MNSLKLLDVENRGKKLGDKLVEVAGVFLKHLKSGYDRGTVNKLNPLPASKIIKVYNNPPYSFGLKSADVRKIVHYLRELNYDIGSGSGGYYYITQSEEYNETIAHERSRLREQASVLKKAINRQRALRGETSELFPIKNKIIEEFKLERIV